jgi:thiamine pyrophosphate-dependent acetolactate synthase large subunit-like protein
LKGAGLGGAMAAALPLLPDTASAQAGAAQASPQGEPARGATSPPVPRAQETGRPAPATGTMTAMPGSDFMVDVLRGLGIEYFAAMTGNTFKGLHESMINYGMTQNPKIEHITCMHEEASVAMAHGYAKAAGKPMAAMMHATVGLQHGSMAIYNAWADRAPVFLMIGSLPNQARRFTKVEWEHGAFDDAAMVREFTKWDDQPMTLQAFTESAVRGYKFMMTPPYGPVLLSVDGDLQEDPVAGKPPAIVKLPKFSPARADDGAIRETAKLLVDAQMPLLLVDRAARTAEGMRLLVELAELLQCPVSDQFGRMNFPWRHPLNQSRRERALLNTADVIVGMEMTDLWGSTHTREGGREGAVRRSTAPGAKIVSISSIDLFMKSNYQDFNRYSEADIQMAADAEASLPALIAACQELITDTRRTAYRDRGNQMATLHKAEYDRSRAGAALGWNDSPITTARLCAEVYEALRGEDWCLASGTDFQSRWPQQLWTADKYHNYIGDSGAYGMGYTAPASLGAALAHRDKGRVTVSINGDGDLMFSNGVLWTAAHDRIPILYVIHNNRAWHQEVMFVQQMAAQRQRGLNRSHIGTTITNPNIDYAKLAQSMGVYGQGPIENPRDLGPALKRAIEVVKKGEPALIDVVSQGR